jgi:hypothetical protein
MEKNPIGLSPRFVHDENRLLEIRGAIERYLGAWLPIPTEWWEEYDEIVKRVNERGR